MLSLLIPFIVSGIVFSLAGFMVILILTAQAVPFFGTFFVAALGASLFDDVKKRKVRRSARRRG